MEKTKTKPSSLIIAGLLALGIAGTLIHTAMNQGSPEAKRLSREAEALSKQYEMCRQDIVYCPSDY